MHRAENPVIYCTTNIINGKKYIGKDTYNNPEYLGSGKILRAAINKYGRENFNKEILQDCIDQDDLNESERYWIDYFGAQESDLFYNIAQGGLFGRMSKEVMLKAIETRKKNNPDLGKHWRGRNHTEESKEKNRIAHLGKPSGKKGYKCTSEQIEKNRLKQIGVIPSKETRDKRGKSIAYAKRNPVLQFDLKGEFIKEFLHVHKQ